MHPMHPLNTAFDLQEVSATHRVLFTAVDRLLEARDAPEARDALAEIQQTLPQHFALEEDPDGLFTWIAALLPGHRDEVRALAEDHRRLLEAAAALSSPFDDEGDLDDVATERVSDFARDLRAHEQRERAALKAAMEAAV